MNAIAPGELSRATLSIGAIMICSYFFICRVVAREIMPKASAGELLVAFWVLATVVLGTFMQLTVQGEPWLAAAIFVAPEAAILALAFVARDR